MAERTSRQSEGCLPTICIQEVYTSWTKRSRGGAGAVARNRVPEELPLPEVCKITNSLTVLFHKVAYAEQGDFFGRSKDEFEVSKTLPINLRGISITHVGDKLIVDWQYHRGLGAPERSSRQRTVLTLDQEQWGRFLYNGRHANNYWDGSGWSYDRRVFNIGLVSHPDRTVFVDTPPTQIFSQMARLW